MTTDIAVRARNIRSARTEVLLWGLSVVALASSLVSWDLAAPIAILALFVAAASASWAVGVRVTRQLEHQTAELVAASVLPLADRLDVLVESSDLHSQELRAELASRVRQLQKHARTTELSVNSISRILRVLNSEHTPSRYPGGSYSPQASFSPAGLPEIGLPSGDLSWSDEVAHFTYWITRILAPERVVCLGAGDSAVVAGLALRDNGAGRVLVWEEDADRIGELTRQRDSYQLGDLMTVSAPGLVNNDEARASNERCGVIIADYSGADDSETGGGLDALLSELSSAGVVQPGTRIVVASQPHDFSWMERWDKEIDGISWQHVAVSDRCVVVVGTV